MEQGDITALEHNVFCQTSGIHVFTAAAVTAQDRETLKELTRIRDNARSCRRAAKPAPSWHEEVFRPLLDHAVKSENMIAEARVQVENMYADLAILCHVSSLLMMIADMPFAEPLCPSPPNSSLLVSMTCLPRPSVWITRYMSHKIKIR
jgi:hypothetical protein